MVRFYDPRSEVEQARVEAILRGAGIEYFLLPEKEKGIGPQQIHVAEEDLPLAEELLRRNG